VNQGEPKFSRLVALGTERELDIGFVGHVVRERCARREERADRAERKDEDEK
jgi:hypothetical protein